jgi:hypothetical protein
MGTQWAPTHLLDNAWKEECIAEQLESNIESYKCKDCAQEIVAVCVCVFLFFSWQECLLINLRKNVHMNLFTGIFISA